ncbi:MAG: TldD/PmbA family protein [Dysgonamonadaceae bacterium]|jgi:TldD protein|nr:TldD/PmbA family protein [Dysgonamonadaceae bacterium]
MLNRFNTNKNDLQKVISVALEKGGDFADLYFEHTFSNSLVLQDGAVNRTASNIDYGVGIRVVSGDKQGYAYVENICLSEMIKAARVASRIANGMSKNLSIPINEKSFQNYYPILSPWEDLSVREKIPFLQKLNDRIFELDSKVVKVNASISYSTSYILYYNSEGLLCSDIRPMAQIVGSCVMQKGNKIENGHASRSARMDASFLSYDLIEEIAIEAITITDRLFDAMKPKGGEMPVVMSAGSSGILLHEAIGHAFEADFNRKKISVFSDQLGKQICNKQINVVDNGCIKYNRGAVNVDDEGIEGQKTYIVKDGKLTSYLHDRISAKHYGVEPTGNGRRQSFRNIPLPRMRATYMESGEYSEGEIIRKVKKGVFVDHFTNGQVQIGAGDFTFFVKTGYLIEDGKLTQPIKDINIIGNGPRALADITMVGRNLEIDEGAWTCGKDGQSMPVSQGLPTILVKRLTVGGD